LKDAERKVKAGHHELKELEHEVAHNPKDAGKKALLK
jgi:hypothetical protein